MSGGDSSRTGRTAALAGVVAAVAYAALFRESAFGGRLPADETNFFDATYAGTVWEQAGAQLRAGKLPLWFHEFDSGTPLAAAWMYGLLYPGVLVFAAFPLGAALVWFCALHAGLGAAGIAYLLSRRGCGAAGAVGGGLLFALSDGMVGRGCVGHANVVAATAWIPWVLAGIDACARGSRRGVALLGLAGGLGLLSGHVQVWMCALPLCVAFAAAVVHGSEDRAGATRRIAAGAAFALGIASPQVVLTAEFLSDAAPLAEARHLLVEASTPPAVLGAKVLSAWSGPPPADPAFDLRPEYRSVAGLWLFALAAAGVAARAPQRWLWAGAAAFGLAASMGLRTPLTAWIFDLPPFSTGRTPARINVLALVALPVLAGHGIAALPLAARWKGVAAAAAAALAIAWGTPPVRSVSDETHRIDWSARIPESAREHRVASTRSHLFWWSNVEASGLRTVRIPCYARTRGHAALLEGATPAIGWWLDIGADVNPPGPRRPFPPAAGELRDASVTLHDAMGGARFFGTVAAGATEAEALARLRAGERSLFLEGATSPGTGARGAARVTAWNPGEIRVEVECDGPGWVLVSSAYARAWTATLDGAAKPCEVERGNLALCAVHVPSAGRHEIVMRYRPWWLGAAALLLTVPCAVALLRRK